MLGRLIIVSAPSGAGKTSLVRRLVTELPDISVSISHTTRPRRSQEVEALDYYYINENEFHSMQEKTSFLEFAKVHNHYYGTAKSPVFDELNKGNDVILEIDWQGAQQVRNNVSQVAKDIDLISIFIFPPSLSSLESRLRTRAQDDDSVIKSRLKAAQTELQHFDEYDYMIVNDNFEQALLELKSIVLSRRLCLNQQKIRWADLISGLV